MNSAFESTLIAALDDLEAGDHLEDILARYPADAAELRPILQTILSIEPVQVSPRSSTQASSRRAFLAAAEKQQQRRPSTWPLFRRLITGAASLILVLGLLGSMLVLASGSTLPGDLLYPLKLTVGEVRLSLADDPAAVRGELAQIRLAELEEMLASGRDGRLELLGHVESLDDDTLTLINGLTLPLEGASGTDLVAVGDEVAILIEVTDGAIRVLEIRLLVPGDIPVAATPTPSATPTSPPLSPTTRPSLTPSATPSSSPTPTPSPSASATMTPIPSSTPSPTASPSNTPPASSTPANTPTPLPPTSTNPPAPTIDPGPGDETQEPEDTPEPIETEEPAETATPAETGEPEETPEPTETDEPAETSEPTETEEPDETPDP